MKAILNILLVLVAWSSFSQTVTMGEIGFPPSNPINCNTFGITGTNFQDPGGTGNYLPNFGN
jgi:hypothetical protein